MRTSMHVAAVGIAILLGVPPLHAQARWTPLVESPGARIWFDSTAWVRHADSTVSMRVRTIESREGGEGGRASGDATIHHMDFDCRTKMYRVTATRFEMADGRVVQLPDAPGRFGQWKRPVDGWREDVVPREVCALTPLRSMESPR